jgi:phosphatidate cytidylyltransferase
MSSELYKRVTTAIIIIPVVVLMLLFSGHWVICLALGACSLLTTFESSSLIIPRVFSQMQVEDAYSSFEKHRKIYLLTVGLSFTCLALVKKYSVFTYESTLMFSILCLFIAYGIIFYKSKSILEIMCSVLLFSFIFCYGALSWVSIWYIYLVDVFAKYLFLLFVIVWFSDTGAYFIGTATKKRIQLAPLLSPNKSWQGAFGGVISAMLGAYLYCYFVGIFTACSLLPILIGLCCSVAGIFGDLFESALKRFAGVKDSGTLFPGHGGLIDRVDSILFAAPVLYIFILFFS